MESRTTRFRKEIQQMRNQAKQENKEEKVKRVGIEEKPFTGMKKEKKGNERE